MPIEEAKTTFPFFLEAVSRAHQTLRLQEDGAVVRYLAEVLERFSSVEEERKIWRNPRKIWEYVRQKSVLITRVREVADASLLAA